MACLGLASARIRDASRSTGRLAALCRGGLPANADVADGQTRDALAEMPLSPDIRWYKESTHEWVPIQIESADTEIMANVEL